MASPNDTSEHAPPTQSAILPSSVAIFIVVVGMFLLVYVVVRNEPFREPFFVQVIRLLLALAGGVVASYLPGYLGVKRTGGGQTISTAGAIAFAVVIFFATPVVAPNLSAANIERPPPPVIRCRTWVVQEYLRRIADAREAQDSLELKQIEWLEFVLNAINRDTSAMSRVAIAESETFADPYAGFTAWVETLPENTVGTMKQDAYAFLVHKSGGRKSFISLPVTYVSDVKRNLTFVPQSQRGDYVILILVLPGTDIPARGANIPVDLKPL